MTDRSRLLQQSKLRDNCALKTNKILPQNLLDHDDIKHLQKSSNCEVGVPIFYVLVVASVHLSNLHFFFISVTLGARFMSIL